MEIEDLRIGNYLEILGNIAVVDEISNIDKPWVISADIDGNGCASADLESYSPIPLTEDILTKNGWKREEDNTYSCGKNLVLTVEEEDGWVVDMQFGVEYIYCRNVHELQNALYYTGIKGVEIKL
jgi:hypothetical protein